MKINDRLLSMKNKTWMYNARLHKILNYKVTDEEVQIVTDKEWLTFPITKINAALEQFLAANEEQTSVTSIAIFQGNGKPALKDLVLENIENIKKDSSYIPKAKALNEQIKTMIEMAKLEIEYKKLSDNL